MALTQIVTTDSVSASVVNTKIVDPANTAISGLQIAQTAGGTGTAITLTGIELTNGYQKTFVINASNSGAATTINGKPLYKPGGTVAPNLTAGKAATVWYNLSGDCFFIKASAEGTAVAGDVLASKTFSNDDDTGIIGTLSLAGDATIADVKTGKTFYNTDAKTKLTGINTDKKWATGTTGNGSTATVTGLSFRPSIVVIDADRGSDGGSAKMRAVYNKNNLTCNDGYYMSEFGVGNGVKYGYWNISDSGFSRNFDVPMYNVQWTAFE